MTNSRFPKIDAALSRLDKAITRLEKAPARPAPSGDLFGNDELTKSRQEYAKLDRAARHVETRLDDMIDRVQNLLESP